MDPCYWPISPVIETTCWSSPNSNQKQSACVCVQLDTLDNFHTHLVLNIPSCQKQKSHKLILDLDVINSSCQSLFFSLPALGPKIVWSASQTGQKDSHAHSLPQAYAENLIANNSFILIIHFYILNTNINFVMCILLRGECNIYV